MTDPSSKAPRLLVAAVIVAAAGAGGYFAYRANAKAPEAITAEQTPAPAAPSGETAGEPASDVAANPSADAGAKKKVPDTLPDITLAGLDGKPTKLASFAGRPLMLNFWATWCAPCRREIPLLNKIREQRKGQNAEIVGVAVDFRDDVLAYVKKTPISYPLLMGEEDGLAAAEAFGMGMAFPFSVFVDSQNRVLTIKVGELHEDEANFAFDRLKDIDNGVLTREAAQAAVADAFREMAAKRAKSESAEAH
ncbi:MAG TPA: TlpA disulfide reductase family protein [Steroidobacteraceae bacterium]|nr:TlpA disulfide reductase family protein [Steroidobacteraceae bacterium]